MPSLAETHRPESVAGTCSAGAIKVLVVPGELRRKEIINTGTIKEEDSNERDH